MPAVKFIFISRQVGETIHNIALPGQKYDTAGQERINKRPDMHPDRLLFEQSNHQCQPPNKIYQQSCEPLVEYSRTREHPYQHSPVPFWGTSILEQCPDTCHYVKTVRHIIMI